MFIEKVDEIIELSIENNYLKAFVYGKDRIYPLVFGSYIDQYSDSDQKVEDFEQMIIGESMDNAVALLILKEYPRLQNRRKAKDLPLKM